MHIRIIIIIIIIIIFLFTGRYEAVEKIEVQSAADQGAISEV